MEEPDDDSDVRKRVERLMSTEIMPHVCAMTDEEIDELCEMLFEFRRKRSYSGQAMHIMHGIVTTGIFRENPMARKPIEQQQDRLAGVTTLIQAAQPQRTRTATEPTRFDPEETYRQRVQLIQHMLGSCGAGSKAAPHTHAKGRFRRQPHVSSRIGDSIVQFY